MGLRVLRLPRVPGAVVAEAAGVVERAASPVLGKAGAFLVSHAKSLGRDVGIGVAADLMTRMIDRAAGAGAGHDPVASAVRLGAWLWCVYWCL